MSNRKYRPRSVVYKYQRQGLKLFDNYTIDNLIMTCRNMRENIEGRGGQSAWAKCNLSVLKEIRHHLEIMILEKTILK